MRVRNGKVLKSAADPSSSALTRKKRCYDQETWDSSELEAGFSAEPLHQRVQDEVAGEPSPAKLRIVLVVSLPSKRLVKKSARAQRTAFVTTTHGKVPLKKVRVELDPA